jgi:hypothetical protein
VRIECAPDRRWLVPRFARFQQELEVEGAALFRGSERLAECQAMLGQAASRPQCLQRGIFGSIEAKQLCARFSPFLLAGEQVLFPAADAGKATASLQGRAGASQALFSLASLEGTDSQPDAGLDEGARQHHTCTTGDEGDAAAVDAFVEANQVAVAESNQTRRGGDQ